MMSDIQSVALSGTVGIQVFSSSQPKILKGLVLTPATSASLVTIRDGNASGEIKLVVRTADQSSKSVEGLYCRFDKGMHVKVLGTGAICYLVVE
jgi:hypothetical protein